MKLEKLIIQNFRAYQERIEISFDDLTAFIGRNDVGKTSILDALGIFFGNKICKYDVSDKCVYSSENDDVLIGCVFSELPNEIVIDAASNTTLEKEFLLNSDGELELYRVFKKGKGAGGFVSRCLHPSAKGAKGILLKKNDELKSVSEK